MKSFQIFSGIAALALMPLTGLQPLAAEQIGDLRLAPEAFAGGFSYHDPSFGPIPTQDIQDSPVLLTSQFTGTSQNPSAGGLGDPVSQDLEVWRIPATSPVLISATQAPSSVQMETWSFPMNGGARNFVRLAVRLR
ncbi:MAG: hypothetical protein ABF377_13135 [Akkermansiaceae bacterium]